MSLIDKRVSYTISDICKQIHKHRAAGDDDIADLLIDRNRQIAIAHADSEYKWLYYIPNVDNPEPIDWW